MICLGCCRKDAPHVEPVKVAAEEEPKIPKNPVWTTAAKVAVASALALGVGIGIYVWLHKDTRYPTEQEIAPLRRTLAPLCNRALETFCKQSSSNVKTCLRDHFQADWEQTAVLIETYSPSYPDFICPANIQSKACDALAGRSCCSTTPYVFEINHETTKSPLPEQFSRQLEGVIDRMIAEPLPKWLPLSLRQLLYRHLLSTALNRENAPWIFNRTLFFKTHVFCAPPASMT